MIDPTRTITNCRSPTQIIDSSARRCVICSRSIDISRYHSMRPPKSYSKPSPSLQPDNSKVQRTGGGSYSKRVPVSMTKRMPYISLSSTINSEQSYSSGTTIPWCQLALPSIPSPMPNPTCSSTLNNFPQTCRSKVSLILALSINSQHHPNEKFNTLTCHSSTFETPKPIHLITHACRQTNKQFKIYLYFSLRTCCSTPFQLFNSCNVAVRKDSGVELIVLQIQRTLAAWFS